MPRRPLLLTLALLLAAPACTKTHAAGTHAPSLQVPAEIDDLGDFEAARNAYALLDPADASRAALREKLIDYLAGYVDEALDEDRDDAAVGALEQLAGLWLPRELAEPKPNPKAAAIGRRVYGQVAQSGDEGSALLALAFIEVFGDAEARAQAQADYTLLQDWLERTGAFGTDPRYGDVLERLLEGASAVFPSPFLTEALADTYLERHRAAQREGSRDPRVIYTGYLVARAHLRADDPQAAVAAIDRLEVDESTRALRDLIADATRADARSSADLVQLIHEFTPEPGGGLPEEIVAQSWGIVDNLSRRALARDPGDPPANLARGRVLRALNLHEAAIVHYERAFAGKSRASDRNDLHRAWSELAELYQLVLEREGARGADEAAQTLARVEDFHARARDTWPQQPVEPGLPMAWMTVAVAEFDAGYVDEAQRLLEEAVALEPQPMALSLLGTIAARRGEFNTARATFERILALPFSDQLERYDWQIRANVQLADIEVLAGRPQAAEAPLREALSQLNTLLGYPGLADFVRVEFLTRRVTVFFSLGEIDLAMKDYRAAHSLAPDSVGIYGDAMTFTFVHAHLDEAREIFMDALASEGSNDELEVYFSLWVADLAARLKQPDAGEEALARLRSYADDASNDAWQRKLALHGLGELDGDALIAAAGEPRQRSEAHFYAGLAQWRGGQHDASLEHMREVIAAGMLGDFEYQMAQRFLQWKELPESPRRAAQKPEVAAN
ncbi:hypothetical protein G6O69_29805 [Pseudenhygromyxa sp. WMMC2535]|uniref:tetratricopeptide repeat protein n=1 Tax=Pseudenhygromyxa sp. WMMC2535 TaxID=2712867 RepID=UPI0015520689|nr:hypothetical protein [Pseudenhygromyxa sp. WMMC2535]NVB42057.1 hypothetical protein [Pseudenhygromyxa sp. WMMC2535]